jgi:hypothetical protein
MSLIDRAERMMQTSPSMLIFICSVSAFTLGYSYTVFAQIADVERKDQSIQARMDSLKDRLRDLETSTDMGFLQIEISANERELYQLELANQRNECPSICVNRMLDIRRGLQLSINRLNNLNNMRDSQ